jgi:hypothetical protein
MTPLEMIAEWERGCSNTVECHPVTKEAVTNLHPERCEECTLGLIKALKTALQHTESQTK